jgi:hypothetical protein
MYEGRAQREGHSGWPIPAMAERGPELSPEERDALQANRAGLTVKR